MTASSLPDYVIKFVKQSRTLRIFFRSQRWRFWQCVKSYEEDGYESTWLWKIAMKVHFIIIARTPPLWKRGCTFGVLKVGRGGFENLEIKGAPFQVRPPNFSRGELDSHKGNAFFWRATFFASAYFMGQLSKNVRLQQAFTVTNF